MGSRSKTKWRQRDPGQTVATGELPDDENDDGHDDDVDDDTCDGRAQ